MDTNEIILQELRELRSDYNEHARDTGERLASLEQQMYTLVGNGQPGRIANIETAAAKLKDTVSELEKWRWKVAGALVAVAALCTGFGWLMEWVIAR